MQKKKEKKEKEKKHFPSFKFEENNTLPMVFKNWNGQKVEKWLDSRSLLVELRILTVFTRLVDGLISSWTDWSDSILKTMTPPLHLILVMRYFKFVKDSLYQNLTMVSKKSML